jgi:hypothetical protein
LVPKGYLSGEEIPHNHHSYKLKINSAVHLPSRIPRFLWGREMIAKVCPLKRAVRLLPVGMSLNICQLYMVPTDLRKKKKK